MLFIKSFPKVFFLRSLSMYQSSSRLYRSAISRFLLINLKLLMENSEFDLVNNARAEDEGIFDNYYKQSEMMTRELDD